LNIGLCHNNNGKFIKALEYIEKALEIDTYLNIKTNIARDCINFSIALRDQGLLSRALNYINGAKSQNDMLRYKPGISYCLHIAGIIHRDKGLFRSGIINISRSLNLNTELNNKFLQASNYRHLAIILREVAQILDLLQIIKQEYKNDPHLPITFDIPSHISIDDLLKKCIFYLNKALDIDKKNKDEFRIKKDKYNLGVVYNIRSDKKNRKKAKECFDYILEKEKERDL